MAESAQNELFDHTHSTFSTEAHKSEEFQWNPFCHSDDVTSPQCLLRIKRLVVKFLKTSAALTFIFTLLMECSREIKSLYEDPPPYIYVVADEKDMTVIHALIIGACDTPYEGGFFYFVLKFPGSYPLMPPWVKFMTTDGGTVRMNPNLYKNGKVCLSILGTWPGPGWSPANSLSTCLISIQSLLGEKPYHNEPGCETERYKGDSQRYNEVIQHETLRVAVCGMIENETGISIPQSLVEVMEKTFIKLYSIYEDVARKNLHLNNQKMQDPFGEKRGTFQYELILKRLSDCKKKILSKLNNHIQDITDSTSPSSSTSDLDDPPSQSDNSTKSYFH